MLLQEGSLVRRWVETWVRVSVRHPWLSAAVWVALTALALWVASGLALKTDLAALLPRTYKSVEQLDRIKEKVGGLERVDRARTRPTASRILIPANGMLA